MNKSQQIVPISDLWLILHQMDKYHRKEGYIGYIEGKPILFDSEPSIDHFYITKEQIKNYLMVKR